MSAFDERFRNRDNIVRTASVVRFAGGASNARASFARPDNTDAYAVGDLVGPQPVAAMEFVAGREFSNTFMIVKARVRKSSPSIALAAFTLHLYTQKPTAANPDGEPFLTDKSEHWIGSIDIFSMRSFTDGAKGVGAPTADGPMCVEVPDGAVQEERKVYGLLEARAAYVPAAGEVFEVTLEVQQD